MTPGSAREKRRRRGVVHLGQTRDNRFGGHTTTSLCGRLRTVADGMNLTEKQSEVTCLFCLGRLRTPDPDAVWSARAVALDAAGQAAAEALKAAMTIDRHVAWEHGGHERMGKVVDVDADRYQHAVVMVESAISGRTMRVDPQRLLDYIRKHSIRGSS